MAVAATRVTPDLEGLDASGVLAYMVERFHPRLAVACSFQKEASVVLDLLLRIAPDARIFTLDTHVLFPETYETWKRVEERYGISIEVHQGPSLGRQAATHGDRLWERDPDECCRLRKVDPLDEALADVDAWISGVRREQSPVRARTPKLAWDAKHERWKANPLADWTEAGRLALHRRARRALQPAARPRLRVDRLHALHQAGRRARRAAGPAPPRPSAACTAAARSLRRVLVLTDVDSEQIADRRRRDEFFWLDLAQPSDEDLDALQAALDLHPMALEDTREFGQRPKVDAYQDYVLIVFFTARESDDPERVVHPVEVHVYVSGQWIVTVHREPLPLLERLHDELEPAGTHEEDYLVYRILDGAHRRLLPRDRRARGADRRGSRPRCSSGPGASCWAASTAASRRCTSSSA